MDLPVLRSRRIARSTVAFISLVVFLAFRPSVATADELIERVLAVAAGDVITLADVTAARELALVPTPPSDDPIGDTLGRLIDRSLMLTEVDRYAPPEPLSTDVDREVAAVRARFPSQEAFERALAKTGMDDAYLRETLRQNLRIREYIEQRFTVPPPGDDDLAAYYRTHLPEFSENSRAIPFEDVRGRVAEAAIAERRQAFVNTWVAGLRRRAEITNLYLTSK